MKRFGIAALAALLVVAFTLPAAAVEHQFGGYWNTRFFMARDFSGSSAGANDESEDYSVVDSRTRLYYTAVLNDALKLVTKFEMDADWGDGGTEFGDIGADGIAVEVKNTYAEIDYGISRIRVGTQGAAIARSFFFDADFSGITVNLDMDDIIVPFYWIRMDEGGVGKDANDGDADYFGVAPFFKFDNILVNPMLFWATTQDDSKGNDSFFDISPGTEEKADLYFIGLNADATFGSANVWFTGIYETGTVEVPAGDDIDVAAYLVGLGGGYNFGMFEAHGQIFYATGDDDSGDDESNDFFVPAGQSYYWSEIMGFGVFDDAVSNGSPGDLISDILAIGIGASVSPMEKLSLGLDIWYAQRAQDEQDGADVDEQLGTEVDFTVKYALLEDLNLTVVAAYLFADDGTDPTADNDDTVNPFELGAQLSLGF
ncbi:MAG: hypothetical protein QNJ22_13720 [Desulfosarcinaceae bacterium]|nr:hypothetical protein [Desulfosarcinaceae bacterium]